MSSPPRPDPFAEFEDRYRCREVDGVGGRRQLVVAHADQHILQRAGVLLTWPIGAEQIRPPWAPGGFPKDDEGYAVWRSVPLI
jgi:hypothetical protein